MSDKYLAVESVLTNVEKITFLNLVVEHINPRMDGAKVADVLSIFDDEDVFLNTRESYWDRYGDQGEFHSPLVLTAIILLGPTGEEKPWYLGRIHQIVTELKGRLADAARTNQ